MRPTIQTPTPADEPVPLTDPYPKVARPIVCLARDYAGPTEIPPARHSRAQLVYATQGVMTVNAPHSTWVLPPQRAVWVPAGIPHWTRIPADLSMRTLYVDTQRVSGLPSKCCVVTVVTNLRGVHYCISNILSIFKAVSYRICMDESA